MCHAATSYILKYYWMRIYKEKIKLKLYYIYNIYSIYTYVYINERERGVNAKISCIHAGVRTGD